MSLKGLACATLTAILSGSVSGSERAVVSDAVTLAAAPSDAARSPRLAPGLAPDRPPDASSRSKAFSYTGELTQGGYIRGLAPSGAVRASLGEAALNLAEDGAFFAAFDRDSPASLVLSATLASGATHRETITIAPREWLISRVNIARRSGGASEAWWKKRKPEYEAITAARGIQTGADGWRQDFIWPVKGRISGRFGRQRIYKGEAGSYHSGIDIAPGNGVPFVAPADGVVVLARTGFSLEGGLIIVDHGAGLNSAFLHCSKIAVEEGDPVHQGQYIGNVGSTGRSTGPHLHWGLKWNEARLDPLLLTGPMR
ncbi:MAG: M23 family metallopeptidase [Pseudomonadota bacterium]